MSKVSLKAYQATIEFNDGEEYIGEYVFFFRSSARKKVERYLKDLDNKFTNPLFVLKNQGHLVDNPLMEESTFLNGKPHVIQIPSLPEGEKFIVVK